jgi:hypothetical protein
VTVGPFPVCTKGEPTWFFPRPADADNTGAVFLYPYKTDAPSSLAAPCKYPVVSSKPPSKETLKSWWSEGAWNTNIGSSHRNESATRPIFKSDSDFSDVEHSYGIGIDPETGAVEEGQFYSANYLRLRDGFRLGVFAEAMDKINGNSSQKRDLIQLLLNGHPEHIVVGGQQRICTAMRANFSGRLPLPYGLVDGFTKAGSKWLVKWILIAPAIWPEIPEGKSERGTLRQFHPGGWLPNWICLETGKLLLEVVSPEERRRRRSLNYRNEGYASNPNISARLLAAVVPKPIPVTGWALPNNAANREKGGAKATHLAVPAGAVYYFEADSEQDAGKLAAALNWHGGGDGTTIRNRRSTIFGEKGFGIGVCGTWGFFEDISGRTRNGNSHL